MYSSKATNRAFGALEQGMWVDFVENNEKPQRLGYGRLYGKDPDDWYTLPKKSWLSIVKLAFNEAFLLFAVSPFELPGRIARSLVPPIVHKFRTIHVDLLGPSLALLILMFLVVFGQASKENTMRAEKLIVSYCVLLPLVSYCVLRCCQAAITFLQLVSLLGYSLYGPVFTLAVSLVIDRERSNTIFFLSLSVFGGLSTLRVVLVILASLRIPAARLLVCSSIALTQLLFVAWLHFTYLHPTFVFGKEIGRAHV